LRLVRGQPRTMCDIHRMQNAIDMTKEPT